MKIEKIKDPAVFVALKDISIYLTTSLWKTSIGGDRETEAEFELALVKSRRRKDDVIKLSKIDTDLSWGQIKQRDKEKDTWTIKYEGDFNPWYNGDLSLEDFMDSIKGVTEFLFGEDNMESAEFVLNYNFLEDWIEKDGKQITSNQSELAIKGKPFNWHWVDKVEGKYQFGEKQFQQKGNIGRKKIFVALMETFEESPTAISIKTLKEKTSIEPKNIRIIINAINTNLGHRRIGIEFKGSRKGYYTVERTSQTS